MAEVDLKNKRMFCRSSHPFVFCKKGPLKRLVKLTGKHLHRSLFLGCRPATFFKKRPMHRFFSVKFLILFRTAVNCCLWFNWILWSSFKVYANAENFDHHIWFYRKYLIFRRSYETIWKPYLEYDIAQES